MTDPKPVALVTGASGTIGSEIAQVLARRGYSLVLHYRADEAAAKAVAASVAGPSVVVQGDLRMVEDVDRVVKAATDEGQLDVVVNAFGVLTTGLLARQSTDAWIDTVQANLIAPYLVCRAVVGDMLRRRYGRIVNLVSPSAAIPSPGQTAYAASKAGLVSLTRSLAAECGRRNVTVNALSPGFVGAKMTADVTPEVKARILERVALRRPGRPEEIARGIEFILDCDYLTGEVITIDGGLTIA